MLGATGLPVHAISLPNFKPEVPVQPGKILSSGDSAVWDAFLHDGQEFLFPQIPGNSNINLILYKGPVGITDHSVGFVKVLMVVFPYRSLLSFHRRWLRGPVQK